MIYEIVLKKYINVTIIGDTLMTLFNLFKSNDTLTNLGSKVYVLDNIIVLRWVDNYSLLLYWVYILIFDPTNKHVISVLTHHANLNYHFYYCQILLFYY